MNGLNDNSALEARKKYVASWNATMINIWKERITLLEVIDSGRLLQSIDSLPVQADGRFIEMSISETFLSYGVWPNYGVGREVYRGNKGDIGRPKEREKKPWFDPRYYSSVMNFNDFMADNMGHEFINTVSSILDDKKFRLSLWPD